MPIEKSAGAIIFRREDSEIYYLLLHYPTRAAARVEEEDLSSSPSSKKSAKPRSRANSLRGKEYWDFPKGHIEQRENLEETVKREVEEETGLEDIKFVEGFKEWIKYFFKFKEKNVLKFVTFYLVETKEKEVKVSFEHIGYKWLPYQEALEQLTFKNAREILKKANNFVVTKL